MVIWERHGNNYRLTSEYDDLMWQVGKKRPVLSYWCADGEIWVHQEGTERMHFSELQWWEPQWRIGSGSASHAWRGWRRLKNYRWVRSELEE